MGESDTKIEPQVEVSVPVQKKKRVPSEKQMEGLRKGQEIVKQLALKRKEIAERNKIREAKRTLGEPVSDEEEEVPKGLGAGIPRTTNPKRAEVVAQRFEEKEKIKEVRKKLESTRPKEKLARRDDLDKLVKKEDFDKLVSMISQLTTKPAETPKEVIREVVKEVPTERVVIKERRMSGSALLDKIFFNKDH